MTTLARTWTPPDCHIGQFASQQVLSSFELTMTEQLVTYKGLDARAKITNEDLMFNILYLLSNLNFMILFEETKNSMCVVILVLIMSCLYVGFLLSLSQ